jgi:predicted nucleic acid-binding protein
VSGFVLDTNVVSIFSPLKNANVSKVFSDWRDEQARANTIYLSAVTIHEIEKGVQLLLHKGATSKATIIHIWLLGLIAGYGDNILPLDGSVARISGQLEAQAISTGHSPGAADAMIAGTAKTHGLSVITHNVKHFLPFGIAVASPDQIAL